MTAGMGGEEGGKKGFWVMVGGFVSKATLPDLQDMSPMVLSCDGPDELFESHKLVLKASLSDSRRLKVFCARGEWLWPVTSFFLQCSLGLLPFSNSLWLAWLLHRVTV